MFSFVGGYWLTRRQSFKREVLRIYALEAEEQPLHATYQAMQLTPQQRELIEALLHKRAQISNLVGRL